MNLDAINADPILKGTPIGDLSVVRHGRWFGVAVVDKPYGKPRIIHVLEPGGLVLDAIYGKRFFETGPVQRAFAKLREDREDGQSRLLELHGADFRRELRKWSQRTDADEALGVN